MVSLILYKLVIIVYCFVSQLDVFIVSLEALGPEGKSSI